MKTQKDYSWLLVAIVLGLALLGSIGCKSSHSVAHIDSAEYAVFEGWPIEHGADFEIEAVFMPLADTSLYKAGQTLWIDSNGFISHPMMHDAETKQYVDPGFQHVVLHERVLPNKYLPIANNN